jgi:3-phenylpropionate/cinnamic acid dioxygenase small subunit
MQTRQRAVAVTRPKAKPKLELTWIGKEDRSRLESRVFEDRERSYHAAERVSENDQLGNQNILLRTGENRPIAAARITFWGELAKRRYLSRPLGITWIGAR